MSEKVSKCISFTGPALREGSMDIRDFAPAMLAFSDLCQETHTILTGRREGLEIRISPDFTKGSFETVIDLLQIYDSLAGIVGIGRGIEIEELLDLILGSYGIFDFIKKTKGKPITNHSQIGKDRISTETIDKKFEISFPLFKMASSMKIRRACYEVAKPLENKGYEGISIDDIGKEKNSYQINKSEKEFFGVPKNLDNVLRRTETLWVYVVTAQLEGKSDWRFRADDDKEFTAVMEDQDFIQKIVNRKIRFGTGDTLQVKRETKESMGIGKTVLKHSIKKVLEHRKEISLFKYEDSNEEET